MKKELKPFRPANGGVQMDANFDAHKRECARCRQFVPEKPATAVQMCLEGAVLYKRDNVTAPQKPKAVRDEHYASKGALKAAMRYRGE